MLALAASALLTILIVAGSRNLEHYDSALFGGDQLRAGRPAPVMFVTIDEVGATDKRIKAADFICGFDLCHLW